MDIFGDTDIRFRAMVGEGDQSFEDQVNDLSLGDPEDIVIEKLTIPGYRYIAIMPGGVFNGKTYTKKTLLIPDPSSVVNPNTYFEVMILQIKSVASNGSWSFSSNMSIIHKPCRTIHIGDSQINIVR